MPSSLVLHSNYYGTYNCKSIAFTGTVNLTSLLQSLKELTLKENQFTGTVDPTKITRGSLCSMLLSKKKSQQLTNDTATITIYEMKNRELNININISNMF